MKQFRIYLFFIFLVIILFIIIISGNNFSKIKAYYFFVYIIVYNLLIDENKSNESFYYNIVELITIFIICMFVYINIDIKIILYSIYSISIINCFVLILITSRKLFYENIKSIIFIIWIIVFFFRFYTYTSDQFFSHMFISLGLFIVTVVIYYLLVYNKSLKFLVKTNKLQLVLSNDSVRVYIANFVMLGVTYYFEQEDCNYLVIEKKFYENISKVEMEILLEYLQLVSKQKTILKFIKIYKIVTFIIYCLINGYFLGVFIFNDLQFVIYVSINILVIILLYRFYQSKRYSINYNINGELIENINKISRKRIKKKIVVDPPYLV